MQLEVGLEGVSYQEIAEEFSTPCYVYSRAAIENKWHEYNNAFADTPHLVCYAVKANSNIAILNLLARLGSGFDIVSGGELARVIAAGASADKVVFSGVGKSKSEIIQALDAGILAFNIESPEELERIEKIAADNGKIAPVSLRINPDVSAETHPYISTGLKENKFGIEVEQAIPLYQYIDNSKSLTAVGIDCHIGSQLTSLAPFVAAIDRLLLILQQLDEKEIKLRHIDIGGGLGIRYDAEQPASADEYVQTVKQALASRCEKIIIEPGRSLVGNAGALLTRVEYLKENSEKNFCIVDAAMNDLMRPSLYSAWHNISVVPAQDKRQREAKVYDVVGPICETGDFMGKSRRLGVAAGDLLVIESAGAYGFTMSSNYNSRPRVAEVLVDNDKLHLIRQREKTSDLWVLEYKLQE